MDKASKKSDFKQNGNYVSLDFLQKQNYNMPTQEREQMFEIVFREGKEAVSNYENDFTF